ncbi:hypothetical protein [Halovulum sp. GXIMD14793]
MAQGNWKVGSGKMGFMRPLIGRWVAIDPDTPMGKVLCERAYEEILDGKFIRLIADWDIGDGKKTYQEVAHYGLNRDGTPAFWSFTSDGGTAYGEVADVSGMDAEAKGFHAEMPSGLARFGFWPDGAGMVWAADAQTKKGWSSMIRHQCERV